MSSFYSDTLVQRASGKLVPGLATAWRLLDETTWEFELRTGVKFANGVAFDAQTVVYNVQRIRTGLGAPVEGGSALWNETARQRLRDMLSPLSERLGTLADAQALDSRTVRITTTQPDPILLGRLQELRIVPSDFDRQRTTFQRRTPGTGPYRIEQVNGLESMNLLANNESWRGVPKLREVRLRFLPEVSARLTALRAGELDIIAGVPPSQVDSLRRAGFQVRSVASPGTIAVYLDTQRNGPLADKRVRQALNLAIGKDAMVKNIFRGEASVAQGQVVTELTAGYDPQLKPYPFDLERARDLLREAGVDQFEEPLRYIIGQAEHQDVAEAVAGYLKTAGVRISTAGIERPRLLSRPGEEQDALGSFHVVTVDPGPALDTELALQYWAGGKSGPKWAQARFLEALAESRRTMDADRRLQLLQEALTIMHEEAPAIFLVQPTDIWAAATNVGGFKPMTGQALPIADLAKS